MKLKAANDLVWHVAQFSEWFGALSSTTEDNDTVVCMWHHDAVKPIKGGEYDGMTMPALVLDGNKVEYSADIPATLSFAIIGYCKSNDLECVEVM